MNEESRTLINFAARVSQYHELMKTFGFTESLNEEKLKQDMVGFNFKKVDPDIAYALGFANWTKECKEKHLLLIPFWLFNYLPDDMVLNCIDESKAEKKNADNDIRCGCVGYMIEVGSEFE